MNMINDETVARVNPITKEKEYLLFRGPSEHDLPNMVDGQLNFKAQSSWTTRPDSAQGYAASHSPTFDGEPVASWIPESKVKNFLPANFGKATDAPAHSEVIVAPIETAYDTFRVGKNKKMPFDQDIGRLFGKPKPPPAMRGELEDTQVVMNRLRKLIEEYKK